MNRRTFLGACGAAALVGRGAAQALRITSVRVTRGETPGCFGLEISTNAGMRGRGEGGTAGARIAGQQFAPRLAGRNPLDIEGIREEFSGRDGLAACHALSAVDLALWDLRGQALGQPVYRLLRGAPVACALGRLALPCGPAEGPAGMRQNLDLARDARARLGPGALLAVDAGLRWTERYAVEMAGKLAACRVAWIEDCLPPYEYCRLGRVAAQIHPMRLAAREGFVRLLEYGAAIVWCPDLHRCGGATELRRLAALAAEHEILVVPSAGPRFAPHCGVAGWVEVTGGAGRAYLLAPERPGFG